GACGVLGVGVGPRRAVRDLGRLDRGRAPGDRQGAAVGRAARGSGAKPDGARRWPRVGRRTVPPCGGGAGAAVHDGVRRTEAGRGRAGPAAGPGRATGYQRRCRRTRGGRSGGGVMSVRGLRVHPHPPPGYVWVEVSLALVYVAVMLVLTRRTWR